MKTIFTSINRKAETRDLLSCLLAIAGWLFPSAARAEIPEPDNLLYGVIRLGTNQVTAANTNIVIEARRTPTGAALASYRMGANTKAGNFYSLRLALESYTPVLDDTASLSNQQVYLVVLENSVLRSTKVFTVGGRGQLTRVDFGTIDEDGNGLLDDWERHYFGALGQNPNADPDGDTLTNLQEQQAGTDPLTADLRHPADQNPTNNWLTIHEVTSYALAWKLGQPWSLPPTNIDLNYVTRAGYLWKNGEDYRLDRNVSTSAPLWWVPGQQVRSPAMKSASRADSVIVREMPAALHSNETVAVTLTVAPAQLTACYAVEERVPAGWTIGAISDAGSLDITNQVIRWGLFFDAEPRTLAYEMMPPRPIDTVDLSGSGSFDGRTVPATGRRNLVRRGFIRLQAAAPAVAGQALRILMQGEPARAYLIEVSEDLKSWREVLRTSADAQGTCEFLERAGAVSHRFYRARLVSEIP
ncbi:MAG: hypothetical protein HZA90_06085 [Verrucomicrobia bacterium]|nr:hypothetical protein [Verrucomicrobiota bacterium]